MHNNYLASFCALFLLVCINLQGQVQDNYIQRIADSLDRIKLQPYKKVNPKGCKYTIVVENQQQFDVINDEITNAIKAGKKNIQVKIKRGVYQFQQDLIHRKNEQSDVSISVVGKDAVITSDKNYSTTGGDGSGWQEMLYANSVIQVVDEKRRLCMIPYANRISDSKKKHLTKVQITQWFRARTYPIDHIDQNGIFFIAPELAWENGFKHSGYNVNYDYLYSGKMPRFRVFDTSKEPNCAAARFLTMENCSIRTLIIKGIEFRSTDASSTLMHFTNVDAKQIVISNCKFDYIRGNGVVYFESTSNVLFDGNEVCNTGGDELFFTNGCLNVRITNNTFKNCGRLLGNFFCIRCYEATYYIANNTLSDFGYGAIGVGVWHGFEKKKPSRGIIEHNEIYFSPEYFANAWKYTLIDSGSIYFWTQNDNVIIRYNYIHDYTGAGDNRGIFCDDGANNLTIIGNVVTNIPNSYCIDSRASRDQKDGLTNNANNFMAKNIVDGRVRFQGYNGENRHVVKGANYVVNGEGIDDNKIENLEVNVEDVSIEKIQDVMKYKEFKRFKYKVKD